jgi:hypothetical protein
MGGWVSPIAVLDTVVKEKIPSPRRESSPRTPIVQPVMARLHLPVLPTCFISETTHFISTKVDIWVYIKFRWSFYILDSISALKPLRVQTGSGAYPSSCLVGMRGSFRGGESGRGAKLTTHVHLAQRSRMRGAILPLSNTPSFMPWCLVKVQGELYFCLYIYIRLH